MRPGYRAFLYGTATDLPTRPFKLARSREADELFAAMRKWNKVISSSEH
jgi:hypothetical protein